MQAGDRLSRVEHRGPHQRKPEQREHETKMGARVGARVGTPSLEPQGADPQIQYRDEERGRGRPNQRERLAGHGPRQLAEVIPEVSMKDRIGDPEGRWP